MRCWKRWSAAVLALTLCMGLLSGCAQGEANPALSVCVGADVETLDPIYATQEGDQTILMHLYENLMRVTLDTSGGTTVTGGMAKSYSQEHNADGTVTWTFRLRSAKWSDGQSVTANDFVYAWRRLADPASGSAYASILSVVEGYDQVRETGDTSLLQVSAPSDNTLEVVLGGNYDWFLTEVCTSPATLPLREDVVTTLRDAAVERNRAAEEETGQAGTERWWSDPSALVTNGPYVPGRMEEDRFSLTANDRYYGSITGPGELNFYFADTAEEAAALYDNRTVDLVWPLTDEEIERQAEVTPLTELGTYTVLFNCNQSVFADQQVRQAMVMAIDRNAAAEAAGITARPAEGLVPPGVPGEGEADFRTDAVLLDNDPDAYAERCAQARQVLEQAGYDSGSYLGQLEYLYVDTPENAAVAQELARQWSEVLRVHVTPVAVSGTELRAALRSGDYTLAGLDLKAVGNDAECFLKQWTSDQGSNVVGYANSAYDTLLSIIAKADDGTARMGCLHDAEVLLLDDAALAPLYTRHTGWKLRDTLTGACRDARGWFCLSGVTLRTA